MIIKCFALTTFQHRPAAAMSHLILVPLGFPGPSQWYILKKNWEEMAINHSNYVMYETNVYLTVFTIGFI
jgi:hypothetical protein